MRQLKIWIATGYLLLLELLIFLSVIVAVWIFKEVFFFYVLGMNTDVFIHEIGLIWN